MMIMVDYDLGRKIVDTCTCECGASLTLPWGGKWGIDSYVIRCPVDPTHDKVVLIKSLYKMWKDGEELPSFIKDSIERKERRKMTEQNEVKALVVKQDADKLSTYVKAKFPQDLTTAQAALDFARWCIAHQLEPIRDCIPYHGNPYITIEWVDRQASQDDKFKGYSYKVFGKPEKEALDFDPGDLVVECQAKFEGLDTPLVGLGVVTKKERAAVISEQVDDVTGRGFRSPVVHIHPQKIVFKRARAAALKQRYHIPAPILEELPYTTTIEVQYTVLPSKTGVGETTVPGVGKGEKEQGAGGSPTEAKTQKSAGAPPAVEAVEGEGFHIDLTWLSETLKDLKWTEDTAKSWLATNFKVDTKGSLSDVLSRLTREQAEKFVKEIQNKVAQKTMDLW